MAYNCPVCYLDGLATASHTKGQRFANYFTANAFELTKEISDNIGVCFVVVERKMQSLANYYERFGFIQSLDNSLFMVLHLDSI